MYIFCNVNISNKYYELGPMIYSFINIMTILGSLHDILQPELTLPHHSKVKLSKILRTISTCFFRQ